MEEGEIPDINLKEVVNEGKKEIMDERLENIKKNMEKINLKGEKYKK